MDRPNILFVMSDDHPCNSISCYGSYLSDLIKTPHIDRLAKEGMRLDACFCTNSICAPSRAVILSGQHSHVNGVRTLVDAFDPGHMSVAKELQRVGYQTAVIGKWHLKTEPQGFDYYNVLPGQGLYNDPVFKEMGKPWEDGRDGGEVMEGYCTDLITEMMVDWIKSRDPSKPFFVLCHHKAPHSPLDQPAKRHENLWQDVEAPLPPSFDPELDRNHGSDASRDYGRVIDRTKRYSGDQTAYDEAAAIAQKEALGVARTAASVDDGIGRLLDCLDAEGIGEDTIVIYTSDQGRFLGDHWLVDKRWVYEEAMRMPFVIRYPREIKAGSVSDALISNLDFAPTFLDFAGVSIPEAMQGKSFRGCLKGEASEDDPAIYYRYWMHMTHHHVPAHYGIRTDRYKLVFFYGLPLDAAGAEAGVTSPGWELYDLEKDPFEHHNIYAEMKDDELVKKLKERLLELKDQYGDGDEIYPELMEVREMCWD